MDELYSYVERKNKNYLITFVTRKPRQIVGYDIVFDKNEKRIQNIADKAPKANITIIIQIQAIKIYAIAVSVAISNIKLILLQYKELIQIFVNT